MRRFAAAGLAAAGLAAAGLLLIAVADGALAQGVEIEGVRNNFKRCHAMVEPGARLTCYDALVTTLEPPSYQGSLTEETPFFKVDREALLRYQSDGPIFVMYLKDADGKVVQNLHIGGGGESTFLITKPGTYNLQVSGTDTWRIWVEPRAASSDSHG